MPHPRGGKWGSVSVCSVRVTVLLRNSSGSVQGPLPTQLGVLSCVRGLPRQAVNNFLWKVLPQEARSAEPQFSATGAQVSWFWVLTTTDFLYHSITACTPSTHLCILAGLSRHLPHPSSCASLPHTLTCRMAKLLCEINICLNTVPLFKIQLAARFSIHHLLSSAPAVIAGMQLRMIN